MRMRSPASVAPTCLTSPTASMRPVNIPFDHDIWTQHLDPSIEQRKRGKRAALERDTLLAKGDRRHKELDVVDKPRVPDGRMERRPSFNHDALHVSAKQLAQDYLYLSRIRGHNRGTRTLERCGAGAGLTKHHRRRHDEDRPGRECGEDALS